MSPNIASGCPAPSFVWVIGDALLGGLNTLVDKFKGQGAVFAWDAASAAKR